MKNRISKRLARIALSHGYEITPTWKIESRPLIMHLRELFTRYRIDSVFDVGANRGQYHDLLREEVSFDGVIFSFEPVSEHFSTLQAKATKDAAWQVFNIALGRADSRAQINVTASPGLNSFLRPRSDVVAGFGLPVR